MKLDTITNKKEIQGEVNPNDEFYTPYYAIEPLLKYLKPNSKILCPFDTEESLYVKVLKANGHYVQCEHIKDGKDFFERSNDNFQFYDYVISNPPYSKKTEVLEKLFSANVPFAMLFGVVGIFESKNRFELFKNNKFEVMYFDKRVSFMRDYTSGKTELNPPFSSVYICHNVLPQQIVFETINKKNIL